MSYKTEVISVRFSKKQIDYLNNYQTRLISLTGIDVSMSAVIRHLIDIDIAKHNHKESPNYKHMHKDKDTHLHQHQHDENLSNIEEKNKLSYLESLSVQADNVNSSKKKTRC